MKLKGLLLTAVAGLHPAHPFHVTTPFGVKPPCENTPRSRSTCLSQTPEGQRAVAAGTAAPMKKRNISVEFVQETPGGYICGVSVKNVRSNSSHRIVVAKDQVEHFSKVAEKQVEISDLVKYIIKYMMDKGVKLDNTEGMIEASVFPVNYFTLKQLTYFHDDVMEKIEELCKNAPDLSEM